MHPYPEERPVLVTGDAEEWRSVVGWEQAYEVSNLGRVRSIPRTMYRRDGRVHHVQTTYRILRTPPAGTGGYPEVHLCLDGKERIATVHTLVLEAFVGPRPTGYDACHDDGDPTNNLLTNLRWDTQSANGLDRTRHGRDHKARRRACPRRHPLVVPNLRAADARIGNRTCLACDRARKFVDYHAKRGRHVDFVAEADARYRQIMAA
jgi:hypothetical protein